jgi:hypothetical protein
VTSLADLAGQVLPFEFSGEGDDAKLCFVGSNGLLGVEKVTFSFSGSVVSYDGKGGQSSSEVNASGSGIAHAATPDGQ